MQIGTFEQWLVGQQLEAKRRARDWGRELSDFGRCECCGAQAVALPLDNTCLPCTKYSFGADEGTEHTGFGIIRGAVRIALEMGVTRETVLEATMDALDRDSTWTAPHGYGHERAEVT